MAGREAVCDSGEKFWFKLCVEAKFRAVVAFRLETFLGKKKICSFVIPDSALPVPSQGSSMVMSWAALRSDGAAMQIGIGSVQTKAALLLFEAVCKKSLQNRLFCEMPAPSRCRSQPDPRRCFFFPMAFLCLSTKHRQTQNAKPTPKDAWVPAKKPKNGFIRGIILIFFF